jgi:hypothetical protein
MEESVEECPALERKAFQAPVDKEQCGANGFNDEH